MNAFASGSLAPTTSELCRLAELDPEAAALLEQAPAPQDLVAALVARERFPEAVALLAHALPTRYAIWWAWLCADRAAGEAAPPPVRAALEAVDRWIREPTDEHRWAAAERAEQAELATAAGCAAFAVFLSGGSLAPVRSIEVGPGRYQRTAPVEPPPYAAAKAVAGSVVLAAVGVEPERAPERFRTFVARGVEVGHRLDLWPRGGDASAAAP